MWEQRWCRGRLRRHLESKETYCSVVDDLDRMYFTITVRYDQNLSHTCNSNNTVDIIPLTFIPHSVTVHFLSNTY